MSRSKGPREPADPRKHITITAYPWVGHTVIAAVLEWSDSGGRRSVRLGYWDVSLQRSDLAGRHPLDVIRLICDSLVRRLESEPPVVFHAYKDASDNPTAVGPGAPASGATGAVHMPPGGIATDSPMLPGLDTV
jgi:hypothetical protein